MNDLVCWIENDVQKWDMVSKEDMHAFLLNLLQTEGVNYHSIFITPANGIMGAFWLDKETHKSSRVDFSHFHEDIGVEYKKPLIENSEDQQMLHGLHEKTSDNTKYGFISPEGKYFHCCYQGHANLADRICFGMVETTNAERYLNDHGWCKIYKPLFGSDYDVYIGENHVITDAQMKTLQTLGLENARHLSDMLCKTNE